ncbi:DNA translocase FtsK [Solibacillus isronensis]|uniref:DNA translocase FtsK n=1 Tax=Solibacillus isronensis TaxID=412383 RepID=UPI0020417671|nr:DNA translocase FtsK [Solibacillus isronensis]MCM3720448.1 FtsK/SpoIIIE domain-containing protein [Solibacillus isronensis]
MSWIKNKFNKLFKMDSDEEYDEYDDSPKMDEIDQTKQSQAQQNYYEEPDAPKKAFRFPLIEDDYEETVKQENEQRQTTRFYDDDKEELTLPNYLQKHTAKEVYEVEVSGIRDLLERRRKGKGHTNVVHTRDPVRRLPNLKEEREAIRHNKPVRAERTENKQILKPIEIRKRFIPTDVPSPVHGFKKPSSIEKLIEKQQDEKLKNEEHEHKSLIEPEHNETAEQPTEPVDVQPNEEEQQAVTNYEQEIHEPYSEEEIAQTEPLESEPELAPVNEEELIEVENDESIEEDKQPVKEEVLEQRTEAVVEIEDEAEEVVKEEPSVAETISDVQVKHVTIENSTIHIGQLNVEQMPPSEEAIVIEEKKEETDAVQPISTRSRVPFNVVMLKSDKQKLMTKQFVEQQLSMQSKKNKLDEVKQENIMNPVEETNEVHTELEDIVQHEKNDEIEAVKKEAQLSQNEVRPVQENAEIITFNEQVVKHEPTNQYEEETMRVPISTSIGLLERESDIPAKVEELLEVAATTEAVVEEVPETLNVQEVPEIQEVTELPSVEEEEEPIVEETADVKAPSTQEVIAEEAETVIEAPPVKRIPYVKPPLEYLVPPEEMVEDRDWMDEQGENLVEALSHFQVQAQIESIVQGPAVTQFEITVGHGTKVSKVRNLTDDIKLALAAKDIRIDAPIPGKRSIGIEIPNRISRSVRLSEVTESASFKDSDSPLEAALGLDLTGKPVTIDLRKMPHGLIAGATGSGKSVCINSILVSLLYKANPNELKLMLIDPKMVELAPFNHIPHLVSPVITDVKAATAALKWAVEEMERRYELFMHSGARKIEAYNKMCDANGMYAQKLPYLLIVIDELADLMMMSPQDVEDSIVRITQKARAAGIHLIVATQRPSVDVITGLIKSNIPTRIAFSVSSQIDSRTILDSQGAERLLGRGDMLYLGNGMSAPTRIQGTFVTDDEIEEIIEYVREQGEPQYIFKQEELLKRSETIEEQDELFEEACRFVFEQGSASTSLLQRRYHIGYNRAARLIDMLERHGYVSEPKGSKPRDVYITEEELFEQFGG